MTPIEDMAFGGPVAFEIALTPRSMPTDDAGRIENEAFPDGREEASGESQNRRA